VKWGPRIFAQVVVIEERAGKNAETDDVCLPSQLLVTNPARGERENDGENDPANGNPGRASAPEGPDIMPVRPTCKYARKREMSFVSGSKRYGEPIASDKTGNALKARTGIVCQTWTPLGSA